MQVKSKPVGRTVAQSKMELWKKGMLAKEVERVIMGGRKVGFL